MGVWGARVEQVGVIMRVSNVEEMCAVVRVRQETWWIDGFVLSMQTAHDVDTQHMNNLPDHQCLLQ